jgi:predicted TIM-barrel fold metal-dependent hydrolase
MIRTLTLILLLTLGHAARTHAAPPEPALFDAHLHYNWEPAPRVPLEQALELFKAAGVRGILANSRPNTGTHALHGARSDALQVVPFLRPYRVRADVADWFNDPETMTLIEQEYRRGYFVGIGEFHLHGDQARRPVVAQMARFAREHGLMLHAHSDVGAIKTLFELYPEATIIWAHTGFSLAADEVDRMLAAHPGLIAELSYRGGISDGTGKLADDWRRLFERYPDRFLLGSDTWIDERWDQYQQIMGGYRPWLAQLPPRVARQIAWGNAARLFGLKP